MRALILVDIQNDFCLGGALAVPDGDAVVDVANRLVPRFDWVVTTQDSHPPAHQSFAQQHPGKQIFEVIDLHGLTQVLWPVHCVIGTAGWEFHPRLDLGSARQKHNFPKGTDPRIDSYSGFFDNDKRHATGLAEFLRERGIGEVYMLGLATDYCVKATALDARRLGFTTHVVEDGCRAVNLQPGDDDRAKRELQEAGVKLTTSDAISL